MGWIFFGMACFLWKESLLTSAATEVLKGASSFEWELRLVELVLLVVVFDMAFFNQLNQWAFFFWFFRMFVQGFTLYLLPMLNTKPTPVLDLIYPVAVEHKAVENITQFLFVRICPPLISCPG